MKNNRRKFLTDMGKLSGVLLFSGEILDSIPALATQQQTFTDPFRNKSTREPLDFRYAPSTWQTTYSYPVDNKISLIDKTGRLLMEHSGTGNDIDAFGLKVVFGFTGNIVGEYIEQKLESSEIPIVITRMKYGSIEVKITSFASKVEEEGRVDNHFFEILSTEPLTSGQNPAVILSSTKKFKVINIDDGALPRKQAAVITSEDDANSVICIIDSPAQSEIKGKEKVFSLSAGEEKDQKSLKYFIRFPRDKQSIDSIKGGLLKADEILSGVRTFWQSFVPVDKFAKFRVHPDYKDFLSASYRNIIQVSEIGPKKRLFHNGPTFIKDMYPADAIFIIEALRYLGLDIEAQEGLQTIWNMQDSSGLFIGSAGDFSFKDSAAAVYALGRHADLTQNYDYFNEMFPDSYKSMNRIREIRLKEYNDGKTSSGKYQVLPRGTIETGVDGKRAELTNTLWILMALQLIVKVANKFYLPYRTEMRDFERELFLAFQNILNKEMKTHPRGFKYLSMLLPDDPFVKSKDKSKHPVPQFAQLAMTKAIFPGLLFRTDHAFVIGHLELMNSILQEDVPAGTGILGQDAVQLYHAPALAQLYIWAGQPDMAVRIFRGFINHASPLFSWRGEQPLLSAKKKEFFGDMPHALAAAECILFLRNSLVLEDVDKLRLLDGLAYHDMLANKPIILTDTPTRWGKVSIALEPVDERTWTFSFKREGFIEKLNSKLEKIEFPRRITQKLQFDKIPGAKYIIQGGRVIVEPTENNWIATFKIFGR